MDHYHIWCNLKPGARDLEFAAAVEGYLGWLRRQGLIAGHRLARRKLGFGPPGLGKFHIDIETEDLAQLERAFQRAATRKGDMERLHAPGAATGQHSGVTSRMRETSTSGFVGAPGEQSLGATRRNRMCSVQL
jgi:hypothetical protein